jgi:hypothetical protein
MAVRVNKLKLLKQLQKIEAPESDKAADMTLRNVSLASALPVLTEISHERIYAVCQKVATHLRGHVPTPPDVDLD